ncbi:iron-containing redox enzyme family protein [Tomitella cavernea]|uniref:Iron-containing redox enzyme family protein n=1 Tax=Tomitella cavernea TaxID=1387982 RepID=A0ABP9CNY2_9ACTN|nr:iron-containing redox enzyme family protein [Tomitella cavernea]
MHASMLLPDDPATSPPLPQARGELSEWAIGTLQGRSAARGMPDASVAEPLEDDLQTALLVCYELHYHGFADVDAEWEWDPSLLEFRGRLEQAFLERLRARTSSGVATGFGNAEPADEGSGFAEAVLDDIIAGQPGDRGPSDHLNAGGSWEHMREYFVHRSIYQLKEADPYVWAIPRLRGQAKSSLAAVEFDEFGAGHGAAVHSSLFADLLDAAGLDPRYLAYVGSVPAQTLAVANLATMFGLHRALRGALIGHFVVTESSTGPGARKLEQALTGMAAPAACVHFYTEHVEADAVHEQVVRHDILRPLLDAEPGLAADAVFGMRALDVLEADLSEWLLDHWENGRSSLPVGDPVRGT